MRRPALWPGSQNGKNFALADTGRVCESRASRSSVGGRSSDCASRAVALRRDGAGLTVIDGGPVVRLRSATDRPYDDAIAAARTCYSPRVIEPDEITDRQRRTIGPLTFDGGHHTVYQHATFEFSLSGQYDFADDDATAREIEKTSRSEQMMSN